MSAQNEINSMFGFCETQHHHHHSKSVRRHSSGHHHHHRPMKLYCAHCVQSYALQWPLLKLKSINWKNFSYKRELKKFIAKLGCVEAQKEMLCACRLNGKEMGQPKTNKVVCSHKVAYGQIYCQYCSKDVTDQFNPTTRQCPNCQQKVHGAMSTADCIKLI
eukprot:165146_1